MSSRPWMPLYVNDFRLDTLDLDAAQVGIYITLLMIAWRREDAAIPNDMTWLKRSLQACTARFHGHAFNRIVPALLARYFMLGADGLWRNKRLTNERQIADKRGINAAQISNKRWSKSKENNGLVNAGAMPSQSQSQSHKKKEDSPSPCSGDDWPEDFRERFWNTYPRHVGKKAAIKKLEAVRKSGECTFVRLLAAISAIEASDPKYIPHPTTWLNRGSYLDDDGASGQPDWIAHETERIRKEREARKNGQAAENPTDHRAVNGTDHPPELLEAGSALHRLHAESTGRIAGDRAGNGGMELMAGILSAPSGVYTDHHANGVDGTSEKRTVSGLHGPMRGTADI